MLLWRRGDADSNRAAKSLFGYSILYLFGLFAVRLVEVGCLGRSVADPDARRILTPEQARRRRRRSVALAIVLAVLVAALLRARPRARAGRPAQLKPAEADHEQAGNVAGNAASAVGPKRQPVAQADGDVGDEKL